MIFLGRAALALAVAVCLIEIVRVGEDALPLLVVALLISGAALTVAGALQREE